MDLYEYQGKEFFSRYGVPTTQGRLAATVEEAKFYAKEVGFPCVLKAQVHVGGRGKAGGIKIVNDQIEASNAADAILGMTIKGHVVDRIWIEQATQIAKEYYCSFTLDRAERKYLLMLSASGGIDIEEVALTNPKAIIRRHIDPIHGVSEQILAQAVVDAGIDEKAQSQVVESLTKLYKAFVDGDADLVEVNPLVLDTAGKVKVLDAKVTLDDNAAFRHPEWESYFLTVELDHREKIAKELGLTYIGLTGSVGIIANGAGLAMATLDVVNQVGGEAANFLDLGGSASADTMVAALEVINDDDNVRSILVNIFGGIVRCDLVAQGICDALQRVKLKAPLVIRLDGTNADRAYEILRPLTSDALMIETTMLLAASRAVAAANEQRN